jgi:uncharacterized protein YkwD
MISLPIRPARSLALRLAVAAALVTLPAAARGLSAPVHARAEARAYSCDVDMSSLALDPEEQAALDETNAYRASYGLGPLQPSYALTISALWKSNDMASRGYFAHDDGFRSWMTRFGDCGYPLHGSMAENIAAGNNTGDGTFWQWRNSPAHNENLLDPSMTAVGLKRVHSSNPDDPYGWYWSMDLGSSLDVDLNAALASLGQ